HSITSKPAIHSLVSANGPSVVRTLPFRLRTVTALSTPARRLPMILTPLPSISATHESILSCLGSYFSPEGSPHMNIRYRIVPPLPAGQAGHHSLSPGFRQVVERRPTQSTAVKGPSALAGHRAGYDVVDGDPTADLAGA